MIAPRDPQTFDAFMRSIGAEVEVQPAQDGKDQTCAARKVKDHPGGSELPVGDFDHAERVYTLPEGVRFRFSETDADHGSGNRADQQIVVGATNEHGPDASDQTSRTKSRIPLLSDHSRQAIYRVCKWCRHWARASFSRGRK